MTPCNDISWNGSMFVAVGGTTTSTVFGYSYDGIIWFGGSNRIISSPTITTGNCIAPNNKREHQITMPGNLMVAVGEWYLIQ